MKIAFALCAVAGLVTAANADVVANWQWDNQGLSSGSGFGFEVGQLPQAADVGSGSFSLANFNDTDTGGVYNYVQSFSGTTLGSLNGISGGSFSLQGASTQNPSNNGAQAIFSFDGSAWTGLNIDFSRRGTSTGFNNVTVEMYANGSSIGTLGVLGAATSTWVMTNYDISALDGVVDAAVVFTFDGASSDTGNNRLDNVTINGVPTPGAFALLGMGGLVASRRRRA